MTKLSDRRKDSMRNEFYEAAVRVLMEFGLESTTMAKVAEEAGAAKGSLYNYFQDKTELLEYVFERTVEPLNQEVESIIASERTATERLRAVLYAVFHYIYGKRQLLDFLLNQNEVQRLVSPCKASGPPLIEQLLNEGVESGEFRACDAKLHATLIYSAIKGVSDDYVRREGPWPIFEIVDSIWHFCMYGLGKSN